MNGKTLRFILQSIFVGLALAFVAVLIRPDLIGRDESTVEVTTAPVAATPPANPTLSYASAVQRAAPAVVNIYTAKRIAERRSPLFDDPVFRHFFGEQAAPPERIQTSLGSGVLISKDGYLLTNNHVIEGADEIRVMLTDERSANAELVGADPDTDLAVLRIRMDGLPAITLGDARMLRVGDVVLAIGNPFGVGQTVTHGIISATGRSHLGINTFEDFIQTDAAINPGNSGGALINPEGELIGINTAIFSKSGGSQGIGFAIPMYLAQDVLKQIIEHGTVKRGWFGIETQSLTPELAESLGLSTTTGVLVAGVLRGGPAHRGGLVPGDVITRIAGETVDNPSSALYVIARQMPGEPVMVEGLRQGRPIKIEIVAAQRPLRQR